MSRQCPSRIAVLPNKRVHTQNMVGFFSQIQRAHRLRKTQEFPAYIHVASLYGFVHPFNLFPEHRSHLLCHLLADAGAHECSPQALILTINAVTGFRPLKRPCRNSSLRQERHIDRFCLGKTDVHQRRRHVCTCVTSINLSTPARANPLATSGLLRVA